MKDNFLQLTTCYSGLVYCRLVVIILVEKLIFYNEILSSLFYNEILSSIFQLHDKVRIELLPQTQLDLTQTFWRGRHWTSSQGGQIARE